MAKKVIAQKLIVVDSVGTLGELGGISGPVTSPCYVPITTINLMLNHHRRVYEVNPKNYNERIRLNLRNLRTENFPKDTETVKARIAPTMQTRPVVRNSNDLGKKDFTDEALLAPKAPKKKTEPKVEQKVEQKVEAPVEEKKDENPAPAITSDFTKNI